MAETRECIDCGEQKLLTDFPVANQVYRRRRCVPCYQKFRLDYAEKNRDHQRQKAREYYRNNTERVKASVSRASKKHRRQLKQDAMNAYGGKCVCCGEAELSFLTIDHVDGNGNEHRRQLRESSEVRGGSSGHFYRWLRNNGYPDGFQTLCFNCNVGRHINGGICPHQGGDC